MTSMTPGSHGAQRSPDEIMSDMVLESGTTKSVPKMEHFCI